MPTITWEVYIGAAWVASGANRLVFSGSATNLATPIVVGSWNDGTHLGSGTPGTDQCGASHASNAKYVDDTHVDLGAGSVLLNDTNVADTKCLRWHFNDVANYRLQSARLYAYNGTTTTVRATGIDLAAYVKGIGMVQWQHLNDDTTSGPFATGGIGGDNVPTGYNGRIDAATRAAWNGAPWNVAAANHYWYILASLAPESAGDKAAVAIGYYVEYY